MSGRGWVGRPPGMPIIPPRAITKLALRKRFTGPERAAIELAAAHNPSASVELQLAAANLRSKLADALATGYVDLDREDTQADLRSLETAGLLATGRADQIIFGEVEPLERFYG